MAKQSKPKEKKKLSELLIAKNPYIRDSWADYADKALTPKYIINRYDDRGSNRFYYFKKDNEVIIAAGATTVFGKVITKEESRFLEKWKLDNSDWEEVLDVTSEFGTGEHIIYGDIMFNKGVDQRKLDALIELARKNKKSTNMPLKDILSFLKFQEDYNLTPLLIEASLVYQDPVTGEWLAMTVDLLTKLIIPIKTKELVQDGVYVRGEKAGRPKMVEKETITYKEVVYVIDFKSNFLGKDRKSFYEGNKLQVQAAGKAIEQNFGIKVDGYFNYAPTNWKTNPSYTLFEHKLTDLDWEIYDTYWKLAQLKGYNKPEGKILVTEGFKNSADFKFLTYKEYVEQVLSKPL